MGKSHEKKAEKAEKKAKKAVKRAKKAAKKVLVAEEIVVEKATKKAKATKRETLNKLAEIADHPLVAEVVAAGAVAAVAALAENKATRASGVKSGSRDLLKLAGAAAAIAIGKKLKAEIEAAKTRKGKTDDETAQA